jgi:two-component system nitrate/nitrite response regulator NarL
VGALTVITAMIVDDHLLFAEAIRSTLQSNGIDVVAIATDGAQAIRALREHRPDLALVDIGLPDQSGLAVGRQILDESPDTKVVAVTALDDARTVKEALRSGFHGYLMKETPVERFIASVLAVASGQVVVPHRVAAGVAGVRTSGERQAAMLAEQLTSRELDVLELIAEGVDSQMVAQRLGISPNTVRTHVQSILSKLQVHSRLEAATFAVRHGIVPSPRA